MVDTLTPGTGTLGVGEMRADRPAFPAEDAPPRTSTVAQHADGATLAASAPSSRSESSPRGSESWPSHTPRSEHVEMLAKELKAERKKTLDAEQLLQETAKVGQILLHQNEELQEQMKRLGSSEGLGQVALDEDDEMQKLMLDNQALEEEVDNMRRQLQVFTGSPCPASTGEAQKTITMLTKKFDEATREWEDALQELRQQNQELKMECQGLQVGSGDLEADLKALKADRDQAREDERALKAKLEDLEAHLDLHEQPPNRVRDYGTSPMNRDLGTPLGRSFSINEDSQEVRLMEDIRQVTQQFMDSEARCLQLEEQVLRADALLAAERRESAGLRAQADELRSLARERKEAPPNTLSLAQTSVAAELQQGDRCADGSAPVKASAQALPCRRCEDSPGRPLLLGEEDRGEPRERQMSSMSALEIEPAPEQEVALGPVIWNEGEGRAGRGRRLTGEDDLPKCECTCIYWRFRIPPAHGPGKAASR